MWICYHSVRFKPTLSMINGNLIPSIKHQSYYSSTEMTLWYVIHGWTQKDYKLSLRQHRHRHISPFSFRPTVVYVRCVVLSIFVRKTPRCTICHLSIFLPLLYLPSLKKDRIGSFWCLHNS